MDTITIKLPFKTPTTNHLYWHRGNIKILQTEARKLRQQIIELTQPIQHNLQDTLLNITVHIYEQWFYKNNSPMKKDISNREKFLIDSVFKGLNIDDNLIFSHHMYKVDSDEEYSIITITPHTTTPQPQSPPYNAQS